MEIVLGGISYYFLINLRKPTTVLINTNYNTIKIYKTLYT